MGSYVWIQQALLLIALLLPNSRVCLNCLAQIKLEYNDWPMAQLPGCSGCDVFLCKHMGKLVHASKRLIVANCGSSGGGGPKNQSERDS